MVSALENEKRWYQEGVKDVFDALESNGAGLSAQESEARREMYGYNELKFKKRGALIRFLMQFHSPLIYVLLASAIITAILDMWMDTAVILAVVIANTITATVPNSVTHNAPEAVGQIQTGQRCKSKVAMA